MEIEFTQDFATQKKGNKMTVTGNLGTRLIKDGVAKRAEKKTRAKKVSE